jgi:hypothetical protein
MAIEKSDLGQPNSDAIGIWNTPKLARSAKLSIKTALPAMRTGVKTEAFVIAHLPEKAGKIAASCCRVKC